ncbi:MAG TPA: tryptophan synthase subunit alpha [Terriglobales bacterium]
MIRFDHKPGLVVYVTCGDPALSATEQIVLSAIDAGTDVIELGVPFSDPVADGPVIQRASERALKNRTSLSDVLSVAAKVRKARPQAGLIIFTYWNPVLRLGLDRFCNEAQHAGVDGALITDLTVEESDDYVRAMRARDLATVFLAAPTSTDERLRAIAEASSGFVYAVSRTGITGAQKQISEDAEHLVNRLRKHTQLPIAVGFGISTPEQFAGVGGFADAAVIGSAIVQIVEQYGSQAAVRVAEFISGLRAEAGQSWASAHP